MHHGIGHHHWGHGLGHALGLGLGCGFGGLGGVGLGAAALGLRMIGRAGLLSQLSPRPPVIFMVPTSPMAQFAPSQTQGQVSAHSYQYPYNSFQQMPRPSGPQPGLLQNGHAYNQAMQPTAPGHQQTANLFARPAPHRANRAGVGNTQPPRLTTQTDAWGQQPPVTRRLSV